MARSSNGSDPSFASLGFEAKLWLAADKLRKIMDAVVTERSDKRRPRPEPSKHAGGRFVQSELPSEATACQFVESPGVSLGDTSIYGLVPC